MDLKGIIAIAGKPGLFKVAAQGRNNIIVQSLENEKKFPAFATDEISALDDISVYTYEKDVALVEVYGKLAEKENYQKSIDHKEDAKKLRSYLESFLPDYDKERVYDSDVKKLFQWYNILVEKGFITKELAEAAAKANAEAEKTTSESETKPEKSAAKPKAKAEKTDSEGEGKPKKKSPAKKTEK